jgi:hypothetical protein
MDMDPDLEFDLDPMPVPGLVRAIACFDDDGPGAIVAGDDVLAVVRWDALDPDAAGRYQRAPSAAARSRGTDGPGVSVVGSQGVMFGSGNVQINHFYVDQPPQEEQDPQRPEAGPGPG